MFYSSIYHKSDCNSCWFLVVPSLTVGTDRIISQEEDERKSGRLGGKRPYMLPRERGGAMICSGSECFVVVNLFQFL